MADNVALVVVFALVVVIVLLAFGSLSAATGKYNVAIQIIDPPNVPAGTQQLIVSYSSVQIHSSGGGNQSGWISASGSGSANLLALTNVSQTMANAQVSANSTINLVRFNITSVKIVINGTAHNVSSPNNQITVSISGGQKINSSSAVIVDFYPTVNSNGSGNATVYVMVPAAKAIVVNSNSTVNINTNVGGTASISTGVGVKLGLNLGIGNGNSNNSNSNRSSYGASVVVHDGQKISNFLAQNVSYNSRTVSGLIYVQYPVATLNGVKTTISTGDTVGYACDNTEFRLTSVNSNNTATFTSILNTSRPGGCPI